MKTGRKARARVASFDPDVFRKDARRPRPDEIDKFYEENKERFRIPEKVQVEYVMAPFDAFQKFVGEPALDEIQKYYDDNKVEFRITDRPAPTDPDAPPLPDEFKKFEEVRTEIYDKIVDRRAREKTWDLIGRLNTELGNQIVANDNDPKKVRMDRLIEKVEGGDKLRHNITKLFEKENVDDVEKTELLGTPTRLAAWAFDRRPLKYDFSSVVKTDAGYVVFQIRQRADAYDPGITRENEGRIMSELARRQRKTRAQVEAERVRDVIQARGVLAGQAATTVPFLLTRYINITDDTASVGLKDTDLANAVRKQIQNLAEGNPPELGQCVVLDGKTVAASDPLKRYWSHVVCLEDVVDQAVDRPGVFAQTYQSSLETHRRDSKARIVAHVIKTRGFEDLTVPEVEASN